MTHDLPDIEHASPSWHIALAEPNKERLAFSHLKRLRYDAYYPLLPIKRMLYGKGTVVYRPMFPAYIFVRKGANQDWYRLETAPGIRVFNSMLARNGTYATITKEQMALVVAKAKYECERILEPEKPHSFEVGDEVRIKVGPFAEFMATIEEIDEASRSVSLETYLFGQATKVRASIDHLSAA